jgi:hypothetical protein
LDGHENKKPVNRQDAKSAKGTEANGENSDGADEAEKSRHE